MSGNVDIVAAFYRAADDTQRRALLDPHVEWVQNDGFPGGGHHHGADATADKVFAEIGRRWSTWRAEVDEFIDAGQTVVAIGTYHAIARTTGRPATAAFAHVYTLTAGRIVRFRQYADTALLVDALSGST